jgi:hypothetical protein
MVWRFLAAFAFCVIAPAAFADPQFSAPLACNIGKDCFVQHYVDADPSPEAKDYTCGSLVYEGHKGTDIRLRNYVEMDKGVDVLAAAPGTVLRLRDGMDDVSVKDIGAAAIKDREAGNSVIVDHGDGWVTQYGHMKKGSIAVKVGQQVKTGDKLGQVGLSGNTEFPHLHFEVRHNDTVIDPATDEPMGAGCRLSKHSMWALDVKENFTYVPTGLLGSGFALAKPEAEAARHGAYTAVSPSKDSPALVFWVDVFGLQPADIVMLSVTGPDGAILTESATPIDKAKDQYFGFAGKKAPPGGWPSGTYHAVLRIQRTFKAALESTAEIAIP